MMERIRGSSEPVQRLRAAIARVAPTDARVLITGENGTGKELVAQAVHAGSKRAAGPMVVLNCAAVPKELIESELFGHERGAFTGADRSRIGRFETANGGTLFLDEVGDMPVEMQAKLLRALQQGEVTRVGASQPIRVDARVIAATNRDLRADVKTGRFREDLYFRLAVLHVSVPPLRDRGPDILTLLDEAMAAAAVRNERQVPRLSPSARAIISGQPFPGNVRELENLAERIVVLLDGEVTAYDLIPLVDDTRVDLAVLRDLERAAFATTVPEPTPVIAAAPQAEAPPAIAAGPATIQPRQPPAEPQHGSSRMYRAGCRCKTCNDWNTEVCRMYRTRKRMEQNECSTASVIGSPSGPHDLPSPSTPNP